MRHMKRFNENNHNDEEISKYWDDNDPNETWEARLRNQLSPLYGLADMVMHMDDNPEIKKMVIESAKRAIENRSKIDFLLRKIESNK